MTNDEDGRNGIRFVDVDRGERPFYTVTGSPLGDLVLLGDGDALIRVDLLRDLESGPGIDPGWFPDEAPLANAVTQLDEYFAGTRTTFDLPVGPGGTPFQRQVWRELAGIPYGATTTYGQIAKSIGRPDASRAVGAANGRNPVPIVLPCHRVIATSGSLIKYGLGGVTCKRRLLDLETAHHSP
jgi:methylated-DNA-[protein]-cysteine S-methyltransferase